MSTLDVPVEELAVHEPDYKHLIAFLKAMEFNTLTRRVAEKSGIEAGEIEADAKLTSGSAPAAPPSPPPPAAAIDRAADQRRTVRCAPSPTRSRRREREASAPVASDKEHTPAELAAAHLAAARAGKIDRGKYETVAHARPAEGLGAARARTSASSRSTPRPPASIR